MSDKRRWGVVGLLFAGMAINYIDRLGLAVAAPVLQRELGLSNSAIGLLLSIFFWAYGIMQLPAGWVVDRYSIKKTYAWAYGGWCLVMAATGLMSSFVDIAAMRALLAIGESASTPASHRAIRYLFGSTERGLPTAFSCPVPRSGPRSPCRSARCCCFI